MGGCLVAGVILAGAAPLPLASHVDEGSLAAPTSRQSLSPKSTIHDTRGLYLLAVVESSHWPA